MCSVARSTTCRRSRLYAVRSSRLKKVHTIQVRVHMRCGLHEHLIKFGLWTRYRCTDWEWLALWRACAITHIINPVDMMLRRSHSPIWRPIAERIGVAMQIGFAHYLHIKGGRRYSRHNGACRIYDQISQCVCVLVFKFNNDQSSRSTCTRYFNYVNHNHSVYACEQAIIITVLALMHVRIWRLFFFNACNFSTMLAQWSV